MEKLQAFCSWEDTTLIMEATMFLNSLFFEIAAFLWNYITSKQIKLCNSRPKLSASCTKKICTHSNYFGWAQIFLPLFKYGILSSKISLWTMYVLQNILYVCKIYWMCSKFIEYVQNLLNYVQKYLNAFKINCTLTIFYRTNR